MKLEIINHGVMYSDYFQGCGLSGTDYEYVATGIGHSEREAFDDALDQLSYSVPGNVDWDEVEKLAITEYGEPSDESIHTADDYNVDNSDEPMGSDEGVYLYLSIRFSP